MALVLSLNRTFNQMENNMSDFTKFVSKVEGFFHEIDWAKVATGIQTAVADLTGEVEPVIEALFPGSTIPINAVVNPIAKAAQAAAQAAVQAASDYAAGKLTAAELIATAQQAHASALALGAVVSAATAKPAVTPAAAAAKPAAESAAPDMSASLS
jgi:hypothetical protein